MKRYTAVAGWGCSRPVTGGRPACWPRAARAHALQSAGGGRPAAGAPADSRGRRRWCAPALLPRGAVQPKWVLAGSVRSAVDACSELVRLRTVRVVGVPPPGTRRRDAVCCSVAPAVFVGGLYRSCADVLARVLCWESSLRHPCGAWPFCGAGVGAAGHRRWPRVVSRRRRHDSTLPGLCRQRQAQLGARVVALSASTLLTPGDCAFLEPDQVLRTALRAAGT